MMYGIWYFVLALVVEAFFGYLTVTAQGPIALLALAIVGFNTLISLSLIFDMMEEPEEES